MMTTKLRQPYFLYLLAISAFGVLLVLLGIGQIPGYERPLNFLLLLILAGVAVLATTSVSVSEKAGITYAVAPAVSLAVVPIYGPIAAAVVEAVISVGLWLLKPADKTTWKRSWEQLAFNLGMSTVAAVMAGITLLFLRGQLGEGTLLGESVPWLVAAVVYDQANIWMLIAILRLQHGDRISPAEIWRENLWAMPMAVMLMSVGGGVLAFAASAFDWIGIIIFFLPILLSAYAIRLYVSQMQEHMNNLENIVAERTKELADLNKEKDAFLAVLTHDMKTPLTSIGLYASLVRDHPNLLQERPHMTDVILRSQRTLLDIVNNILDLEKLQTGGTMPMDRQPVDLAPLIEYTVESVRPQAIDKDITLQSEPSQPLTVSVDRQQIERVMMNLISNAVKYTPSEGTVTVSARKNGRSVLINVVDSGYGIPEDELPHIFERYRRVSKHKDKAVGTGLGLAITKALVEAHDGELLVESLEGVGSTFTVRLPLARNDA